MFIHVKVTAGAKKETFEQVDETHFSVLVKEKAERNEANSRVIELIRKHFEGSGEVVGQIKIVSGHHSPSKLLSVNLESEN